jgi:hypothetical protein
VRVIGSELRQHSLCCESSPNWLDCRPDGLDISQRLATRRRGPRVSTVTHHRAPHLHLQVSAGAVRNPPDLGAPGRAVTPGHRGRSLATSTTSSATTTTSATTSSSGDHRTATTSSSATPHLELLTAACRALGRRGRRPAAWRSARSPPPRARPPARRSVGGPLRRVTWGARSDVTTRG